MLKIKDIFKLHKTPLIPEYDKYLALYSEQFRIMTNEQLQEEYNTLNGSGLSAMQKLAKADSLHAEFRHRGLK